MRKLAVLGIALLAVLALTSAPGLLTYAFIFFGSAAAGGSSWKTALIGGAIGAIPCVILVVLAWWLLANRERLADKWFPDASVEVAVDPSVLLPPAVALLGLWLSVSGLSGVFRNFATVIQEYLQVRAQHQFPLQAVLAPQIPTILAELLTFGLGLLIVLRRKPLAQWLMRERRDDA